MANRDGYMKGVRDGRALGNLEGTGKRILAGIMNPPPMPRADD